MPMTAQKKEGIAYRIFQEILERFLIRLVIVRAAGPRDHILIAYRSGLLSLHSGICLCEWKQRLSEAPFWPNNGSAAVCIIESRSPSIPNPGSSDQSKTGNGAHWTFPHSDFHFFSFCSWEAVEAMYTWRRKSTGKMEDDRACSLCRIRILHYLYLLPVQFEFFFRL